MPKYRKGQTSDAVREKSEKIEEQIDLRIELLEKLTAGRKIHPDLITESKKSLKAPMRKLLSLNDGKGINSISWGAARTKPNYELMERCLKGYVSALNIAATTGKARFVDDQGKPARMMDLNAQNKALKEENRMLASECIRLYRAYHQLLSKLDDDQKMSMELQRVLKRHRPVLQAVEFKDKMNTSN